MLLRKSLNRQVPMATGHLEVVAEMGRASSGKPEEVLCTYLRRHTIDLMAVR
jgi:hypothetical protein